MRVVHDVHDFVLIALDLLYALPHLITIEDILLESTQVVEFESFLIRCRGPLASRPGQRRFHRMNFSLREDALPTRG